MNPEFWQSRWQEGRIGFNQFTANPLLTRHCADLQVPIGSRLFVPLCGKSIDMLWLAMQGYDVVGVELVETAVQAFFAEQHIEPTIYQHADNPAIKYYQGQLPSQSSDQASASTITLWVADIFSLTLTDIGAIDAIYDKAALIALPADMRIAYSEQMLSLCRGADGHVAPQLLLTLNYDQTKKDGPPFSISDEQIQHYYGNHYQISELNSLPTSIGSAPDLTVTEHVWLLSSK